MFVLRGFLIKEFFLQWKELPFVWRHLKAFILFLQLISVFWGGPRSVMVTLLTLKQEVRVQIPAPPRQSLEPKHLHTPPPGRNDASRVPERDGVCENRAPGMTKKSNFIILYASCYCSFFLLEVNGFRAVNSAGVWRRDQFPFSLHVFDCGQLHSRALMHRRRPLPNLPASDTCSD